MYDIFCERIFVKPFKNFYYFARTNRSHIISQKLYFLIANPVMSQDIGKIPE